MRASVESSVGKRALARAMVITLLLSCTLFERIGVGSSDFSVTPALASMYLLLAAAMLSGFVTVSRSRLALYLMAVGVALVSAVLNERRASLPSFFLLAVMYLPFVFVLGSNSLSNGDGDGDGEGDGEWVLRQFSNLSFVCALAGIVQFFAQFVVHGAWLFDYTTLLPPSLRVTGIFNTVIPVGGFNKSNGFFFREPSGFSFVVALGVLAEATSHRRWARLACYAVALLVTYSGTGILVLLIGASYPLGRKTFFRLGSVLCVGGLLFAALDDALGLSYTLARAGEFDNTRSSGYIRYLAPGRLLAELFGSEPWSPWFGHGPGTIFRTVREYEFHDPTWAKLLFEYGLFGFVLVLLLFLLAMRRPDVPIQVRAALFWAWLVTGGHLLSPEQNYLSLALVGLLPLSPSVARRRTHSESSLAPKRGAFEPPWVSKGPLATPSMQVRPS